MLTYCPGRNASSERLGISTENRTVVADSRVNSTTVPVKVAACVLAMSEVLAICSTRSDCGFMLHGNTYPRVASSTDSASSM